MAVGREHPVQPPSELDRWNAVNNNHVTVCESSLLLHVTPELSLQAPTFGVQWAQLHPEKWDHLLQQLTKNWYQQEF